MSANVHKLAKIGGMGDKQYVLGERSWLDFAVGICWGKLVVSVVFVVNIVGYIFEVLHVRSKRHRNMIIKTKQDKRKTVHSSVQLNRWLLHMASSYMYILSTIQASYTLSYTVVL